MVMRDFFPYHCSISVVAQYNGIQQISGLIPGFDISTCPLAPASEFLKKGLSGKYILAFTCPNGQADFLCTTHFLMRKMV